MNKYKELILLISDKISSKKDKKYILDNIDTIASQFNKLSYIINKLFHIISDISTSYYNKIKQIQYLTQFSKKQTYTILDKINIKQNSQLGGATIHQKQLSVFDLPFLSVDFFKNIELRDFTKPLDFVYIYLFVTASIPIIGSISDFLIIIKSLEESNIFLASIVFITRFISFFTLNMVDMGPVLKLIYSMDNYSYISDINRNDMIT